MSRTDTAARTAPTANAEALLRDMAFVLRMTQKVKSEMTRPADRAARPAPRTETRAAVVAC